MTGPARHGVLVYDDDAAFAGHTAAFLDDGIANGAEVIAVVDPAQRELLGQALGATTARMTFIDRDSHYSRPEAALADYDAMLRRSFRTGAHSARLYGELPSCSTQEQWDSWIGYDAILNRAFARYPVVIMCGYDARVLPTSVVDGARRAHPEILEETWRANPRYDDPDDVVRSVTPPPLPLPDLEPIAVNGDARAFRAKLTEAMAAARVAHERAARMLLAASEVFANAGRHAGGARTLRAGSVGERFVCELSDRGPGLDDPMVGYVPPDPAADAGAGLWVARQLTERLELLASGDGLTARLWV